MPSLPHRAERLADMVLSHPLAQRFSFRVTSALIDVSRGSTSLDPDAADRLVCTALEACITSEILAAREMQS